MRQAIARTQKGIVFYKKKVNFYAGHYSVLSYTLGWPR